MSTGTEFIPAKTEQGFCGALLEKGKLTELAAERLQRVQSETGDRLASVLLKLGLLSEDDLAAAMTELCGLSRFDSASLAPEAVELGAINKTFLRAHELVPISRNDGE